MPQWCFILRNKLTHPFWKAKAQLSKAALHGYLSAARASCFEAGLFFIMLMLCLVSKVKESMKTNLRNPYIRYLKVKNELEKAFCIFF